MLNAAMIWTLSNFDLAMFILAVIFILFHLLFNRRLAFPEIVYRWIAFFALGLCGIYAFIMHAFFPTTAAAAIGWVTSPFQFEVAMADLSLGVLGILSFNANVGFRMATVVASICMLWGDAIGHLYQIFTFHNYSVGNAGSWLWMDIIVPLILLICVLNLKREKKIV